MSIVNVKSKILSIVNEKSGCKALELVPQCVAELRDEFDFDVFSDAIDELVSEGNIVRIRYVLESMDYREKEIYLPKCRSVIFE